MTIRIQIKINEQVGNVKECEIQAQVDFCWGGGAMDGLFKVVWDCDML